VEKSYEKTLARAGPLILTFRRFREIEEETRNADTWNAATASLTIREGENQAENHAFESARRLFPVAKRIILNNPHWSLAVREIVISGIYTPPTRVGLSSTSPLPVLDSRAESRKIASRGARVKIFVAISRAIVVRMALYARRGYAPP